MMVWWVNTFKNKLDHHGIKYSLMERFVDDINGVFDTLPLGTDFNNDKMLTNDVKAAEESHLANDERTMKVIQKIANSVDEMIEMTIDVPSRSSDKKLPASGSKSMFE